MSVKNTKILVVDDEEVICDVLSTHFRRRGYVVITANSAEEALPIIKEQCPEIMLLDKTLPGMSGVDLLKLVRKFNKTIKVIIVSGHDLDPDDPEFKGLNILKIVQKPVPFDVLDLSVEKATQ